MYSYKILQNHICSIVLKSIKTNRKITKRKPINRWNR